MTIKKNSVEQINVALLDMDKKIKSAMSNGTSASDFKNLEASVESIKRNLNETTAGLESGKTYNINISGNAATATKATTAAMAETATTAETATNANSALTADTATNATTATKVANALTVNGKTYDGSSAVDVGVQTVENGGTGQTTAQDAADYFIGSLPVGDGVPVDTDYFISQVVNGGPFIPAYNRRPISKLWEYIKGKISSVLGLTKDNYGGKAASAGTADSLFYAQGNEINFNGGTPGQCWFNYRNADTGGPSPVDTMEYRFCNYSGDTSKSVLMAGSFNGTTAKASSKMVIPIGAPSSLEDGCIWIER